MNQMTRSVDSNIWEYKAGARVGRNGRDACCDLIMDGGEPESLMSIANWLQISRRGNRLWFPCGDEIYLLFTSSTVHTGCGSPLWPVSAEVNSRGMKFTIHLHRLMKLRMNGALCPLRHASFWSVATFQLWVTSNNKSAIINTYWTVFRKGDVQWDLAALLCMAKLLSASFKALSDNSVKVGESFRNVTLRAHF